MGRRRVKLQKREKDKGSLIVKQRVVGEVEVKREGKGWRKCNHRCVQIKWEEEESSYKKEKMTKEV